MKIIKRRFLKNFYFSLTLTNFFIVDCTILRCEKLFNKSSDDFFIFFKDYRLSIGFLEIKFFNSFIFYFFFFKKNVLIFFKSFLLNLLNFFYFRRFFFTNFVFTVILLNQIGFALNFFFKNIFNIFFIKSLNNKIFGKVLFFKNFHYSFFENIIFKGNFLYFFFRILLFKFSFSEIYSFLEVLAVKDIFLKKKDNIYLKKKIKNKNKKKNIIKRKKYQILNPYKKNYENFVDTLLDFYGNYNFLKILHELLYLNLIKKNKEFNNYYKFFLGKIFFSIKMDIRSLNNLNYLNSNYYTRLSFLDQKIEDKILERKHKKLVELYEKEDNLEEAEEPEPFFFLLSEEEQKKKIEGLNNRYLDEKNDFGEEDSLFSVLKKISYFLDFRFFSIRKIKNFVGLNFFYFFFSYFLNNFFFFKKSSQSYYIKNYYYFFYYNLFTLNIFKVIFKVKKKFKFNFLFYFFFAKVNFSLNFFFFFFILKKKKTLKIKRKKVFKLCFFFKKNYLKFKRILLAKISIKKNFKQKRGMFNYLFFILKIKKYKSIINFFFFKEDEDDIQYQKSLDFLNSNLNIKNFQNNIKNRKNLISFFYLNKLIFIKNSNLFLKIEDVFAFKVNYYKSLVSKEILFGKKALESLLGYKYLAVVTKKKKIKSLYLKWQLLFQVEREKIMKKAKIDYKFLNVVFFFFSFKNSLFLNIKKNTNEFTTFKNFFLFFFFKKIFYFYYFKLSKYSVQNMFSSNKFTLPRFLKKRAFRVSKRFYMKVYKRIDNNYCLSIFFSKIFQKFDLFFYKFSFYIFCLKKFQKLNLINFKFKNFVKKNLKMEFNYLKKSFFYKRGFFLQKKTKKLLVKYKHGLINKFKYNLIKKLKKKWSKVKKRCRKALKKFFRRIKIKFFYKNFKTLQVVNKRFKKRLKKKFYLRKKKIKFIKLKVNKKLFGKKVVKTFNFHFFYFFFKKFFFLDNFNYLFNKKKFLTDSSFLPINDFFSKKTNQLNFIFYKVNFLVFFKLINKMLLLKFQNNLVQRKKIKKTFLIFYNKLFIWSQSLNKTLKIFKLFFFFKNYVKKKKSSIFFLISNLFCFNSYFLSSLNFFDLYLDKYSFFLLIDKVIFFKNFNFFFKKIKIFKQNLILLIRYTLKNFFLTLFFRNLGKVLITLSSGSMGYKGQAKSSHLVSRIIGGKLLSKIKKNKLWFFDIVIKSFLNKRLKEVFYKIRKDISVFKKFVFKRLILSIVKNHGKEKLSKRRRV